MNFRLQQFINYLIHIKTSFYFYQKEDEFCFPNLSRKVNYLDKINNRFMFESDGKIDLINSKELIIYIYDKKIKLYNENNKILYYKNFYKVFFSYQDMIKDIKEKNKQLILPQKCFSCDNGCYFYILYDKNINSFILLQYGIKIIKYKITKEKVLEIIMEKPWYLCRKNFCVPLKYKPLIKSARK